MSLNKSRNLNSVVVDLINRVEYLPRSHLVALYILMSVVTSLYTADKERYTSDWSTINRTHVALVGIAEHTPLYIV